MSPAHLIKVSISIYRKHGTGKVPGQEFANAIDGMLGDTREHRAQIEGRIKPIQLGSADQSIEGGGTHTSRIGAEEQIVFPAFLRTFGAQYFWMAIGQPEPEGTVTTTQGPVTPCGGSTGHPCNR